MTIIVFQLIDTLIHDYLIYSTLHFKITFAEEYGKYIQYNKARYYESTANARLRIGLKPIKKSQRMMDEMKELKVGQKQNLKINHALLR